MPPSLSQQPTAITDDAPVEPPKGTPTNPQPDNENARTASTVTSSRTADSRVENVDSFFPETSPTSKIKSQSQDRGRRPGPETQAIGTTLFHNVESETETEAEVVLNTRQSPQGKKQSVSYKHVNKHRQNTLQEEGAVAEPTIPDSDAAVEEDEDVPTAPAMQEAAETTKAGGIEDLPSKRKLKMPKRVGGSSKRKASVPRDSDEVYDVDSDEQPSRKRTKHTPKAVSPELGDDSGTEIAVAAQSVGKKAKKKTDRTSTYNSLPTPTPTPSQSLLAGAKLKVLITKCDLDDRYEKWLKIKAQIVKECPGNRAHWVCVVRKEAIPTTAKVLETLLCNRLVVSETWITDSYKAGELLEPQDYVHPDVEGTIGDNRRKSLFNGITLFFTTDAVTKYDSDWSWIQSLARQAGSMRVESGSPAKGDGITPKDQVVFLSTTSGQNAASLIKTYGRVVYDKALLTNSIVRGSLDLDSNEFKIVLKVKGWKK